MLIELLNKHYKSELAKGNPLYPPAGMELKRIHFILLITPNGELIDIEECEGMMSVVKSRARAGRDAAITPNFMWDSLGYVTGFGGADKHHASFKAAVRNIANNHPNNSTFKAVDRFYYRGLEQLYIHPLWNKVSSKKGHNITFRVAGEFKTAAQQSELITHNGKEIALLHPKIYINGASGTGAKLVSYGVNQGYESYNLKAGENCSISQSDAEGYAAAITALRQMNGEGNVVIGDVTFLYFSDTVIALVPNVARISTRLILQNCSIEKLTSKEIISSLMFLAPYNDPKRLSSQFIVDFVEAMLTDKPLPCQTLQYLLKNKNKSHPTYINLLQKILNIKKMALDKNFSNMGYLLGRMLAIVERAQKMSQPNITYTVKDQLYSIFSVTPAALFNRLFSLSITYFRRIPSMGTQIYLKTLFSEVADKISTDGVPMRLSLEDQGRFALGYQHQNQSFYTKNESDNERNN